VIGFDRNPQLIAAWVPLTYLTRDPQATRDGFAPAFALACGLLGVLVARRQPRNLEGWLLLGLAVGVIAVLDGGLYAVLDYRLHDGRLLLGESAVFIKDVVARRCSCCSRWSSCCSRMAG
jgi:peptidoglycan/LPS O-acetylase OafA/YrhL